MRPCAAATVVAAAEIVITNATSKALRVTSPRSGEVSWLQCELTLHRSLVITLLTPATVQPSADIDGRSAHLVRDAADYLFPSPRIVAPDAEIDRSSSEDRRRPLR
jgi:hypothetical protein